MGSLPYALNKSVFLQHWLKRSFGEIWPKFILVHFIENVIWGKCDENHVSVYQKNELVFHGRKIVFVAIWQKILGSVESKQQTWMNEWMIENKNEIEIFKRFLYISHLELESSIEVKITWMYSSRATMKKLCIVFHV